MNLAQKVPLVAILLLATLAGLLFLIEHVRTLDVRAVASPPTQVANARPQPASVGAAYQPVRMLTRHPALIIPVQGVAAASLADTWGQARSEGRAHQGIDIIAPSGAPVLAAADGRIVKFFDSVRGGITIYQFDEAERLVYYYAHLSARAPALTEGAHVSQGELIGFVGSTGNATTPHLHFEIQRLGAERKWWAADSVNPYPYLINGTPPR